MDRSTNNANRFLDLRIGNGRFIVKQKLGGGSFGEIFSGIDTQRGNKEIAIKLEQTKTRHPQLLFESRIYKLLHSNNTIQMLGAGAVGAINAAAQQYYGAAAAAGNNNNNNIPSNNTSSNQHNTTGTNGLSSSMMGNGNGMGVGGGGTNPNSSTMMLHASMGYAPPGTPQQQMMMAASGGMQGGGGGAPGNSMLLGGTLPFVNANGQQQQQQQAMAQQQPPHLPSAMSGNWQPPGMQQQHTPMGNPFGGAGPNGVGSPLAVDVTNQNMMMGGVMGNSSNFLFTPDQQQQQQMMMMGAGGGGGGGGGFHPQMMPPGMGMGGFVGSPPGDMAQQQYFALQQQNQQLMMGGGGGGGGPNSATNVIGGGLIGMMPPFSPSSPPPPNFIAGNNTGFGAPDVSGNGGGQQHQHQHNNNQYQSPLLFGSNAALAAQHQQQQQLLVQQQQQQQQGSAMGGQGGAAMMSSGGGSSIGAPLSTSTNYIVGIPEIHYFGAEGDYNVMVIDLCGPSLEDLFCYCGRRFSLKTICLLADQMLHRIQFLHSKYLIHRDLKPENFVMGMRDKAHHVNLIDFGLAKRYWDTRSNQHIPHVEGKPLTGTARYCSVNTHLGVEQSRRDDMESIGYIILYFYKGALPWQGIRALDPSQKTARIGEKKVAIGVDYLCRDDPPPFMRYMKYCRGLKFEETPDYQWCRRLFIDLGEKEGIRRDWIFDWVEKRQRERMHEESQSNNGSVMDSAAGPGHGIGSSITGFTNNPNVNSRVSFYNNESSNNTVRANELSHRSLI